jgi:hypothetical protein
MDERGVEEGKKKYNIYDIYIYNKHLRHSTPVPTPPNFRPTYPLVKSVLKG